MRGHISFGKEAEIYLGTVRRHWVGGEKRHEQILWF